MSAYVKNFDEHKEIKSSRDICKSLKPVPTAYMDNKHCEHCYPEKRSHFRRKFFNLFHYFIFNPFIYLLSKLFLLSEHDFLRFNNLLNQLVINIFQKLKLYTKTQTIDRKQFNNSVLAFWDEAQKRGLELYNLRNLTCILCILSWSTIGKNIISYRLQSLLFLKKIHALMRILNMIINGSSRKNY